MTTLAAYEVIDPDQLSESSTYQAPFCSNRGDASSRFRAPDGFGQFVCYGSMAIDAQLVWGTEHGDEGIFVRAGEIEVNGRTVGAKGAVVIESNVATVIRALRASEILHVGTTDAEPALSGPLGPPAPENHDVHIFGPDGQARIEVEKLHTCFYTDSTCPTCRIALFRVGGTLPYVGPSHSHSGHELITVTEGEIRVGRDAARTGVTIAIPGGRRYGFRTGENWEFVNYRSDLSYMTGKPGSPSLVETVEFLQSPEFAEAARILNASER